MLSDRDDIKIFILYILNSIGYPLEYGDLHDMSIQDGFITSFDYIEAFEELLDAGNLLRADSESGEDDEDIVTITDKGRHIAETLNGRLLSSVKERAMKSALRYISFKKKGTKISTGVRAMPRGKYELTCTIIDEGYEIMELKFILDNMKQIDRMVYNFDAHPEHIYRGILALLSGEVDYLLN